MKKSILLAGSFYVVSTFAQTGDPSKWIVPYRTPFKKEITQSSAARPWFWRRAYKASSTGLSALRSSVASKVGSGVAALDSLKQSVSSSVTLLSLSVSDLYHLSQDRIDPISTYALGLINPTQAHALLSNPFIQLNSQQSKVLLTTHLSRLSKAEIHDIRWNHLNYLDKQIIDPLAKSEKGIRSIISILSHPSFKLEEELFSHFKARVLATLTPAEIREITDENSTLITRSDREGLSTDQKLAFQYRSDQGKSSCQYSQASSIKDLKVAARPILAVFKELLPSSAIRKWTMAIQNINTPLPQAIEMYFDLAQSPEMNQSSPDLIATKELLRNKLRERLKGISNLSSFFGSSSEEDANKEYKRFSVKFHPDKQSRLLGLDSQFVNEIAQKLNNLRQTKATSFSSILYSTFSEFRNRSRNLDQFKSEKMPFRMIQTYFDHMLGDHLITLDQHKDAFKRILDEMHSQVDLKHFLGVNSDEDISSHLEHLLNRIAIANSTAGVEEHSAFLDEMHNRTEMFKLMHLNLNIKKAITGILDPKTSSQDKLGLYFDQLLPLDAFNQRSSQTLATRIHLQKHLLDTLKAQTNLESFFGTKDEKESLKAFNKFALKVHPDKQKGQLSEDSIFATQIFNILNDLKQSKPASSLTSQKEIDPEEQSFNKNLAIFQAEASPAKLMELYLSHLFGSRFMSNEDDVNSLATIYAKTNFFGGLNTFFGVTTLDPTRKEAFLSKLEQSKINAKTEKQKLTHQALSELFSTINSVDTFLDISNADEMRVSRYLDHILGDHWIKESERDHLLSLAMPLLRKINGSLNFENEKSRVNVPLLSNPIATLDHLIEKLNSDTLTRKEHSISNSVIKVILTFSDLSNLNNDNSFLRNIEFFTVENGFLDHIVSGQTFDDAEAQKTAFSFIKKHLHLSSEEEIRAGIINLLRAAKAESNPRAKEIMRSLLISLQLGVSIPPGFFSNLSEDLPAKEVPLAETHSSK